MLHFKIEFPYENVKLNLTCADTFKNYETMETIVEKYMILYYKTLCLSDQIRSFLVTHFNDSIDINTRID